DGRVWSTPARVDKGELRREDIVCVCTDGLVEGGHKHSSEFPFHQMIYEQYLDIGAILNASPVNVTAFSVTTAALDSRTIPESYILLRDVGRVPYGIQFQQPEALAQQVSTTRPIALLENDGVLVVGAHVLEAFDRLEV